MVFASHYSFLFCTRLKAVVMVIIFDCILPAKIFSYFVHYFSNLNFVIKASAHISGWKVILFYSLLYYWSMYAKFLKDHLRMLSLVKLNALMLG